MSPIFNPILNGPQHKLGCVIRMVVCSILPYAGQMTIEKTHPRLIPHGSYYELTCISSSKCSEWPINCQFPSQIPHNKLTGVQCSSAALFPAAIHCINILNETLNPPSHASSIRVGICFCAKSDPNSDLYLRRIDPVYF